MNANYKSISELDIFEGNVNLNDVLIISRQPDGGAQYTSNAVKVISFANALSSAILADLIAEAHRGLGNLSNVNKEQLENNKSDYSLTSFVPKGDNGTISSNQYHAISAIEWNDDKKITSISSIDIAAISANILTSDVVKMLTDRGLNDGIKFVDNTKDNGILLGILSGNNFEYNIKSGNPTDIISVDLKTDIGEDIAEIIYCNGTRLTLKDNLNIETKNVNYSDNKYCGDAIAVINGTVLKNNLDIYNLTEDGQHIATINGTDIKNGLVVTPQTDNGNIIANINGTDIKNGLKIENTTNIGQPICTINDIVLNNNVEVIAETESNEYRGDHIATINTRPIYNGIKIEDDVEAYQTSINGHKILGGIRLGKVYSRTTAGNIIAEIEVPDGGGKINLYSGIDINTEKDEIISTLRAEIDNLRAQHSRDIAALTNLIQTQYVKLNSSTKQIIQGPVKFTNTIEGNITNADVATKAKWSS